MLINFFASWCAPCQKSKPQLEALRKEFPADAFALIGVNVEGTGARAFAGASYVSAGKTGTAQVIAIKQGEKYVASRVAERHRDHALFVAYAPANAPKIAVAVVVENAGFGAVTAAPIARKVFDYYLLGKKVAPVTTEELNANTTAR